IRKQISLTPQFIEVYGVPLRSRNCFNSFHTWVEETTRVDSFLLSKGASSHWVNENRIVRAKFRWGRGYGAFSVSHSNVDAVSKYIANQEEHHRRKTFAEEYEEFVRVYGLQWLD